MKKTITCLAALGLATCAWTALQFYCITRVGETSAPEPADVIIVLGAAVWPQGPSPALQARVYHASTLYHQGYAKYMILSGGLGEHPPSEAEAMRRELLRLGVKPAALRLEKNSGNTIENLKFSKSIMEQHGWVSAIIVTDAFHLKRVLLIARDQGIRASGSPAKDSVLYKNRRLRTGYTMREVVALSWYYLIRGGKNPGKQSEALKRVLT